MYIIVLLTSGVVMYIIVLFTSGVVSILMYY